MQTNWGRREIVADEKLKPVFGKARLDMFQMTKRQAWDRMTLLKIIEDWDVAVLGAKRRKRSVFASVAATLVA
jgi:chromatin remodeling complex protein RSC6